MLSFYGWVYLLGGLAPGLFLSQAWLVMSGQRARSRGETDRAERTNLWFLWLAFAYALVVYGFVGDLVRQQGRLLPIPLPLPLLTALLVIFGIGSTALAFWKHFATQIKDYEAYSVIRFACAEAIGIYGLILYLRGSSWATFGSFLAWALTLLVIVRPTAQSQRQFRERVTPTGKVLTGRIGWTLANAVIFVWLAIGLGIFLKRTRGFSTINAVLCALFFAIMLLAPLVPMLRQS